MPSISESDIDRDHKTEKEKRAALLGKWKKKKGSAATYKRLIQALLDIECREEAEGVCELLQKSSGSQQQHPFTQHTEKLLPDIPGINFCASDSVANYIVCS